MSENASSKICNAAEVGSPLVICREPGHYIGWPSLAQAADGTLFAVFSGNRIAHVCPYGVVQIVSSTDGGVTWSEPRTIGDTPVDDRDASIHILPNGEILVTWFNSVAYCADSYWRKHYEDVEDRDINELVKLCGRWCVRSSDGGKTWTSPARMQITGSAPHGGIVLKDGALLAVGRYTPGKNNEGTASSDLPTLICCERSTDGGRTWTMLCEKFPDVNGEGATPHVFHEPHVAELPDGSLVALIRYHGGDNCFRRSISTDGGRTWSPMMKTSLKAGETAPHLLALPDGRLVCTYGLRAMQPMGEFAAISSDAGLTWSEVDGICLRKTPEGEPQGNIGYPATIRLPDGDLYTVFYEPEQKGEKPCLMGVRWKLPAGSMSERQQALAAMVDKHAKTVLEAERWIWAHPQTGFTEWQAHEYLAKHFESLGYKLTLAGNIPGFYTDLDTGRPGPKVCVLAELDALDIPGHPEAVNGIAHLCGHHAQCAALLGIASALKEPGALDGLSGSIRLMLVPSEELVQVSFRDDLRAKGTIRYFGGKTEFMYRGFFDGVDMTMNVHQGGPTRADGVIFDAIIGCNGCITKKIIFKGKTAHAGANPSMGVNAQYAAMLALQACNDLRETFPDWDQIRWHPVMRDSGCAVNNIPDKVLVESYVRGRSLEAIKRENKKINRAITGAALAMGACVELHDRPGYAAGTFDENFLRVMEHCCADMVGRDKVSFSYTARGGGSTDMSDLACVMPCAWFNVNGGFTGCGHRVDYKIVDPYRLCVDSAKAQILVIDALLKDAATAAKEIVSKFKPRYSSIKAYLEANDEIFLDQEAVTYDKDGHATVRYW